MTPSPHRKHVPTPNPLQVQPDSSTQVLLQPSSLLVFPSSHCSGVLGTALPHGGGAALELPTLLEEETPTEPPADTALEDPTLLLPADELSGPLATLEPCGRLDPLPPDELEVDPTETDVDVDVDPEPAVAEVDELLEEPPPTLEDNRLLLPPAEDARELPDPPDAEAPLPPPDDTTAPLELLDSTVNGSVQRPSPPHMRPLAQSLSASQRPPPGRQPHVAGAIRHATHNHIMRALNRFIGAIVRVALGGCQAARSESSPGKNLRSSAA